MAALTDAAAAAAIDAGVTIRTHRPMTDVSGGRRWSVDGEQFDVVVLATPADVTANAVARLAPEASAALSSITASDVIMVRVLVDDWPTRLAARSGYLVPKPDQHLVTAVSFASEKWDHWRPDGRGQVLRVSLGRDGLPVDHLDDDHVIDALVDEVGGHLGLDLQPQEISITRWQDAFAQYRPHHHELVSRARRALPGGIAIAGAAYDGIGIPACVASGRAAASAVKQSLPASDRFLT
jgi:oxygen-dependent protoporphyrinogen oxidase